MKTYTVTRPGGADDREIEAYEQLLDAQGIDVARSPRVPEPETGKRWLFAWDDPAEAERFARELRSRTGNEQWAVRPCEDKWVRTEPLDHLVIYVSRQSGGATFRLQTESKLLVRTKAPRSRLLSTVYVGDEGLSDLEAAPDTLWGQVAIMLTGLTEEQLATVGGFRIVDSANEQTYYTWPGCTVQPNV
jgi:hypothetical protein